MRAPARGVARGPCEGLESVSEASSREYNREIDGKGLSTYLSSVHRPLGFAVERARVPHRLEQYLREADRVRGWTRPTAFKRPARGIRDVFAVVRAIQIHAVPARGEAVVDHDAHLTRPGTHVLAPTRPFSSGPRVWMVFGCDTHSLGNSSVSGSRVPSSFMQMYVSWRKSRAPSRSLFETLPTSMRKPGLKAVTGEDWVVLKSASVM